MSVLARSFHVHRGVFIAAHEDLLPMLNGDQRELRQTPSDTVYLAEVENLRINGKRGPATYSLCATPHGTWQQSSISSSR